MAPKTPRPSFSTWGSIKKRLEEDRAAQETKQRLGGHVCVRCLANIDVVFSVTSHAGPAYTPTEQCRFEIRPSRMILKSTRCKNRGFVCPACYEEIGRFITLCFEHVDSGQVHFGYVCNICTQASCFAHPRPWSNA